MNNRATSSEAIGIFNGWGKDAIIAPVDFSKISSLLTEYVWGQRSFSTQQEKYR